MAVIDRQLEETFGKRIYERQVPYHRWGDDWAKWDELDLAIQEMSRCARESRIFVYDKEKWGCYDCSVLGMWDGTLRWILGKYSVRANNKWYDKIDKAIAKVLIKTKVVILGNKFQLWLYNHKVQKVLKEHPNIVHELVSENTLYNAIKPTRKGYVDGKRIFDLYWTNPTDSVEI